MQPGLASSGKIESAGFQMAVYGPCVSLGFARHGNNPKLTSLCAVLTALAVAAPFIWLETEPRPTGAVQASFSHS